MTNKQKQILKAKAHHLKPVVKIGSKGLTDAVHEELNQAFKAHQLIKVKLDALNQSEIKQYANSIVAYHQCFKINQLGRILVLYKRNYEQHSLLRSNS